MHYWLFTGIGTLAVFGLSACSFRRRGFSLAVPLWSFVLSCALGTVCSKVFYVLLKAIEDLIDFGPEVFLETRPSTFSFFGGCVGVFLAVWAASGITHTSREEVLDIFSLYGAALVAVWRGGEYFLGTLGAGPFLDSGFPLNFPPFVISNGYGESFFALPLMEILSALVLIPVFFRYRGKRAGLRFETVIFYLALPQIIWESMRLQCMKWGFVRIEQLLCALLVWFLVWRCCHLGRDAQPSRVRRYLPFALILICAAIVAGMEFALDKTGLGFTMSYLIMALSLVGMGWLRERAYREIR